MTVSEDFTGSTDRFRGELLVADLLGTTTTAVNSGLRRARAQLAQVLPAEDELAEPAEPGRRALLERFAAAVENADASALANLLTEDVALEMPPVLAWFAGRAAVVGGAHAFRDGITRIVSFVEPAVFTSFGLPARIAAGAPWPAPADR